MHSHEVRVMMTLLYDFNENCTFIYNYVAYITLKFEVMTLNKKEMSIAILTPSTYI